MSHETRHQLVESIFLECLEAPAERRADILAARCGADASLRAELEDLLARDAAGAPPRVEPLVGREERRPVLSEIGRYKIVAPLGEGGFGEVYEALQVAPVRRPVALKLLKRGMDSAAVLSRFEAERQALALMDHPGIAKVHDAGEAQDGRPYFVMELVRGEPITDWCEHAAVSLRGRLELFVGVCHAVQHAHQKGVIHRDLKPSNILVSDADGVPRARVIDFGIAKAVAGSTAGGTLVTRKGEFLGTPEYMSPEQAKSDGADVDTRSDVYSLGVVLYRLLTGRLPFDARTLREAGLAEVSRILRDEEPRRPSEVGSAWSRQLRGDLDWIVMRAMEKERDRRYGSAAALAEDVERHLRDEPVLAGPPSAAYRISKLARRHRGLVVGSAAVVLALLVGVVTTGWQAVRARRAETEALRQAGVATAVNGFLTGMLAEANPKRNPRGLDITVREMVDRAAGDLGTQRQPPEVEAGIAHTLGITYDGLGLYANAEQHLRRAIELREGTAGPMAPATVESRLALANAGVTAGRYAAAESSLALLAGELSRRGVADRRVSVELNRIRGGNLANLGRYDEADSLLRLAVRDRRSGAMRDDRALTGVLADLAELEVRRGRFDSAESLAREALDIARRVGGDSHHQVAIASGRLASILRRSGEFSEAEALYLAAIDIDRRALGPRHPWVAQSYNNLAVLLTELGRLDEAERWQRESVDLLRASHGDGNVLVGTAEGGLAHILQLQGDLEPALALRRSSLAIQLKTYGEQDANVARARNNLASVYRLLNRYDEAAAEFRLAIAVLQAIHGERNPEVLVMRHNLAKTLLDAGRATEAEPLAFKAKAAALEAFPAGHVNLAVFEATHARALLELGRPDQAEGPLLHAHGEIVRVLGEGHARAREVAGYLTALYTATGQSTQAAKWRARSL